MLQVVFPGYARECLDIDRVSDQPWVGAGLLSRRGDLTHTQKSICSLSETAFQLVRLLAH
jgi:hypothetical protein